MNVSEFRQTIVIIRVFGQCRAKRRFAVGPVIKHIGAKDFSECRIEFRLRKVLPPGSLQHKESLQSLALVKQSLRKAHVGFYGEKMESVIASSRIERSIMTAGSEAGSTDS